METTINSTAAQMKVRSFAAIKNEVENIYKQIEAAADKGLLNIPVENISDAARVFFTEKGFKLKIAIRQNVPMEKQNQFSIYWD